MDDFVSHPISPLEKKTKTDPEDMLQEEQKENSVDFTQIREIETFERNMEEEKVSEIVDDDELETTEVNDEIQIVEASSEEIEVIETLEELESALEEVLSPPTSPTVVPNVFTKIKTTVPFNLASLVEGNRAQLDLSKKVSSERRFMARISSDDAATAEAELSRQISQKDFEKVTGLLILSNPF